MDNKLYFDNETLQFVQAELLFRSIAHQKVLIHLKLNHEIKFTKEEVNKMVIDFRTEILKEMYEEYGHTPGI